VKEHAGENLADVLRQRQLELPPSIQMCGAASRIIPKLRFHCKPWWRTGSPMEGGDL